MIPLQYHEITDRHPRDAEVTELLAKLPLKQTFLFLAMINILISLYSRTPQKFTEVQGILFKNLIDDELFDLIKRRFGPVNMASRPLFHRAQVLALMKRCLTECRGVSDISFEDPQLRYQLGTAALMMNDLIEMKDQLDRLQIQSNHPNDKIRIEEELVAQVIPNIELLNPPNLIPSFVRNDEYFKIFERENAKGKKLFSNSQTLSEKFQTITGVRLKAFLQLILTLDLSYYLRTQKSSPAELVTQPALLNEACANKSSLKSDR